MTTTPGPDAAATPPVTPAATPPVTPPPAAAVGTGGFVRSSTGRTIGLIVGGVVLFGALGAGASAAFGGDNELDTPKPHATGLGVETDTPKDPSGAEPGGAVQPSSVPTDLTTSLPSPDASGGLPTGLPPTGFGSTTPSPVSSIAPSSIPSTEPTEPSDEPSSGAPSEVPGIDPSGDGNTEQVGDTLVYRPDGWTVDGQDDSSIAMSSGDGSWAYAFTGTVDPATEASAVISDNVDNLLPGDNYSQLKFSEVTPLEPFGSLVSASSIDYQSLWVDAQTSIPLYGQIYAAIRQDGTALVVIVEHSPPEDFESQFDILAPIVNNTFSAFGGS